MMDQSRYEALGRLCTIAKQRTGQSKRVADFLLSWHDVVTYGGWDITDLWRVDAHVSADILKVLALVIDSRLHPADLGFEPEISAIERSWRK